MQIKYSYYRVITVISLNVNKNVAFNSCIQSIITYIIFHKIKRKIV